MFSSKLVLTACQSKFALNFEWKQYLPPHGVLQQPCDHTQVFTGKTWTAFSFLQEHKYDIMLMVLPWGDSEDTLTHRGYINISHGTFPVRAEPLFPIRFKALPLQLHLWALFFQGINSSPYQHPLLWGRLNTSGPIWIWRQHIPHLQTLLKPTYVATHKSTHYEWSPPQQKSVQMAKQQAILLVLPKTPSL